MCHYVRVGDRSKFGRLAFSAARPNADAFLRLSTLPLFATTGITAYRSTPPSSYHSCLSSLLFLTGPPFPTSQGRTDRFLALGAKFIKGPRILYSVPKSTANIDFPPLILRRRHSSILFRYPRSFACDVQEKEILFSAQNVYLDSSVARHT